MPLKNGELSEDLPLSWSRTRKNQPHLYRQHLLKSKAEWLSIAELPEDAAFFDIIHNLKKDSNKKFVLRGCGEELSYALQQQGFEIVPVGVEAVIDLQKNMRRKKSLHKLLRYSLKYGSCEKIAYSKENVQKLNTLMQQTRHAEKPQLFHLFNTSFTNDMEGFIWKSRSGEWLAAITISRINKIKVQAELLLRKEDAINGSMEALIYSVANDLAKKGYRSWSLGEVPFIFDNPRHLPIKSRLFVAAGRRFRFAYDAQNLFSFKNKFSPKWTAVYLCGYPRISYISLVELAIKSNYLNLIKTQFFRLLGQKIPATGLIKKIFAGSRIKQFKINHTPHRTIGI